MRFLKSDRARVKWLNVFAQEDGASDMDWGIYTGSDNCESRTGVCTWIESGRFEHAKGTL